jgi:phosphatidylglycerophosphatase A
VGGVGYAPLAPGTAGAAAGVVVFVFLSHLDLLLYGLTVVTLTVLGVWAASQAEAVFRSPDDGRIVIDEVAGQLVALAPLVPLRAALPGSAFLLAVVTGFVVFRVFDVWKPGPVRACEERFEGGLGVMMDDVVAGLLSAAVLGAGLLWLAPAGSGP